jgi:predicted ester cyclase
VRTTSPPRSGSRRGVVEGNYDSIDEVMADDVVDHDPALFQGPGPEGFKEFFRYLHNAFPDVNIEPEYMVATDDDVAVAYTLTGTHRGEFLGVQPTERAIEVRGVQIVERRGSSDELGILRQLGEDPTGEEREHDKGLIDKAKDKLSGE